MHLNVLPKNSDLDEDSFNVFIIQKFNLKDPYPYTVKDNGYKDRNGMLVTKWLCRYNTRNAIISTQVEQD